MKHFYISFTMQMHEIMQKMLARSPWKTRAHFSDGSHQIIRNHDQELLEHFHGNFLDMA